MQERVTGRNKKSDNTYRMDGGWDLAAVPNVLCIKRTSVQYHLEIDKLKKRIRVHHIRVTCDLHWVS